MYFTHSQRMQMNDLGNALSQVRWFCPRFPGNLDVATLSISVLNDGMFSSRRQIRSPQLHRFAVLEMNTSRCFTEGWQKAAC